MAVLVLTLINVVGLRASTDASKVMAVIKVAVLAAFAFFGLTAVKASHFVPFAPSGLQGVLTASAIVFFAYTGYARIATLGEEIKEPRKTIPKAILVSLAITIVVYVAVVSVGIGLVGVQKFGGSNSPIASRCLCPRRFSLGGVGYLRGCCGDAQRFTLVICFRLLELYLLWRVTATFQRFFPK